MAILAFVTLGFAPQLSTVSQPPNATAGALSDAPAKIQSPTVAQPTQSSSPKKVDAPHLPNAYRLHENVISGGQPDGEDAFRELQQLGVKTVISVDGARPGVELAKKYGLRYVHLPHGYDGIPEQRVRELAKVVRDSPGPVYVHCHHGKHRSPAAAVVACISVGWLQPSDVLGVLKTASTSENYRGLYQSASSARQLDGKLLDALQTEFREIAVLPPLAEAMVSIEHTHDRLKMMAANQWQRLPKHPDLTAAHETLLLREHFTELLRTDATQREPEEFRQLIRDSESAAKDLEQALMEAKGGDKSSQSRAVAAFDRITKNCAACHNKFRDIPLTEKQSKR